MSREIQEIADELVDMVDTRLDSQGYTLGREAIDEIRDILESVLEDETPWDGLE